MDLEFTDDDDELRANVRSVLTSISPPRVVRDIYEGRGTGDAVWAQMVALDWPGLAIAEQYGGIGMGFLEAAIVCEELGRATAPGAYLATVTQFVPMARELAGATELGGRLLAEVAAGRLTGTVALAEQGRWEPAAVQATAEHKGDQWMLNGAKVAVLDGARADEVIVVARSHEGLGAFVVPGRQLATIGRLTLDPTMPLADITLDGVVVPDDRVLAAPGSEGVATGIARATQEATVALAVCGTGASRAIFDQTVEYAKQREQYGKLIGSFQALKHRMANMSLALERASSLCWYAVLTIAEDDERRDEAASLAKAAAGECQRLLVQDGLQLHGGIGFTWEHDLHFLLNRARTCDALYGNSTHHRGRLAVALGLAEEDAA